VQRRLVFVPTVRDSRADFKFGFFRAGTAQWGICAASLRLTLERALFFSFDQTLGDRAQSYRLGYTGGVDAMDGAVATVRPSGFVSRRRPVTVVPAVVSCRILGGHERSRHRRLDRSCLWRAVAVGNMVHRALYCQGLRSTVLWLVCMCLVRRYFKVVCRTPRVWGE